LVSDDSGDRKTDFYLDSVEKMKVLGGGQAGGPEVAEGFEVRVPCPRRSEGGAFFRVIFN
jgi:hypothetical protein